MQSSLRVAFFTLRDSYIDNEGCFHDSSNARLVQELSRRFRSFSFITYRDHHHAAYYNCRLDVKRLYVLPFVNTFGNGILHWYRVWEILRKAQAENDVLIIQFPFKTFFLPMLLKKPVVAHICSNLLTASRNKAKYKGLKRTLSISYALIFHAFNKLAFGKKNFRIIANGSELARLYSSFKAIEVISSSIFEKEIINEGELRRPNGVFTILFVGRPSLEKGFDTLLDSFTRLSGDMVKLVCAGFTRETFDGLYPRSVTISPRIEFIGQVPFSDELLAIYKSADVLVLPSRSEGTPRVLVEARAQGCPVIASRVGGIPSVIDDGIDGLLFEAGDADRLANLIQLLIDDEDKRTQLARNGIARVRSMTIEKFSDIFVKTINEFGLK